MEKIWKHSTFFIGCDLHWVTKPWFVRFSQITGYIKNYDGNKFLTIVDNQKNNNYSTKPCGKR